jgi:hypothetical protein
MDALRMEYEAERNRLLVRWGALRNKVSAEANRAMDLLRDASWAKDCENKTKLAALYKEFSTKHEVRYTYTVCEVYLS